MNYERLVTYGDLIQLNIKCSPKKLFQEIKNFEWQKYNPRTDNPRYGLSITSLDGKMCGIDLDSLYQYNSENDTRYNETHFKTFTSLYHMSEEVQKIVNPFINHIARSHIINLKPGGYFPPHRDLRYAIDQLAYRIIVPLKNCNPPYMHFKYENISLQFEHGRAYFLNTNKMHAVFSMRDSYFIVLNVISNNESHKIVLDNLEIN